MDHSASREQDYVFDLESGTGFTHVNEEGSQDPNLDEKLAKTVFLKLCDGFTSVDNGSIKSNINECSHENNVNCKKAPSMKKPPRPPKGFSLTASDQKLIKELAELAIIKRARIERMKALKQKKNLKISSSSSSHSSLFAMLFTIIFFLVILLQGHSKFGLTLHVTLDSSAHKSLTTHPLHGNVKLWSTGRNSGVTFQGSPQMAQT